MEHSLLNTIIRGLIGITTLGGLAIVGSAPGSSSNAPLPPSEGGWRLLDPVTYENISIFPVVTSAQQDTSAFLTLDEGLSSGDVIVSEQGAAGLARTRDSRRNTPPRPSTSSCWSIAASAPCCCWPENS
jgi:hypothetical protein